MKIRFCVLWSAMLALCLGCAREIEPVEKDDSAPEVERVPLVFTADDPEGTKTEFDSNRHMKWSAGDKIKLFSDNDTQGAPFAYKKSGDVITFEGEGAVADKYFAIYPYGLNDVVENNGASYSVNGDTRILSAKMLTQTRGVSTGNFPKMNAFMVGISNGSALSFRQVCAFLKVTVPEGINCKQIFVFPNNNAQKISGAFNVQINEEGTDFVCNGDGTLKVNITSNEATTQASLKPIDKTYFDAGDYYIPVLPQNLTDGIRFKISYDTGDFRAGNASAMELKPGRVYNMGTLKKTNIHNYCNFENGQMPSVISTTNNGQQLTVVTNIEKTAANPSKNVLKVDCSKMGSTSGITVIAIDDKKFTNKSEFKAVRMKVYLGSNEYYPHLSVNNTGKMATLVDGIPVKNSADAYNALLHQGDGWHVLEWQLAEYQNLTEGNGDMSGVASLQLRPLADRNNGGTASGVGNRVVYVDDIQFGSPSESEGEINVNTNAFQTTCKESVGGSPFSVSGHTVESLPGFIRRPEPDRDNYGGWLGTNVGNADGYFRVRKINDRWWMVDPDGNLFLSQGVATFSPGGSDRQKAKRNELFGGASASWNNWYKQESAYLKDLGFNSLGAWSEAGTAINTTPKTPSTVILSPMSSHIGYLRSQGLETAAFEGSHSWERYPYDVPMVFDEHFDSEIERLFKSTDSGAAKYKENKYFVGYFVDNEIPWRNDALDNCFKWPSSHINHQKAQQWLDERKGHSGALPSEATESDKKAFVAYLLEVYLKKVTDGLKKYDPNHLFFGCRFNQWLQELDNEELFRVAGKYMDAISVNVYHCWELAPEKIRKWEQWSGKPVLVSEFYVKGEDADGIFENESGLTNESGAGWVVPTQNDRGLFYENFVLKLIESKACVGWHWFSYMDNDPTNSGSDSSNTNSNKGIVSWDYQHYESIATHMSAVNKQTYNLARFMN